MKPAHSNFTLTRLLAAASFVCMVSTGLWAQELRATIVQISGKVEIKTATSEWKEAQKGQKLNAGDLISTGFKSKAVLKLTDDIILVANQLTRLSLNELYKKGETVKTDLYLDVGNVRTQVNTTQDLKQDLTVRTGNSTASVRGTVLEVALLGDGRTARILAWDGRAEVQNTLSGKQTQVGEAKKKPKAAPEPAPAADTNTPEAPQTEESETVDTLPLVLPPSPPTDLSFAPVIAGSSGALLESSTVLSANTTVVINTRPSAPGTINIGGGSIQLNASDRIQPSSLSINEILANSPPTITPPSTDTPPSTGTQPATVNITIEFP